MPSLPSAGSSPSLGGAQRFLPLQNAAAAVRRGSGPAGSAPTGALTGPAVSPLGSGTPANVVPLRLDALADQTLGAPAADEATLQAAWEPSRSRGAGMPSSKAAARERRRHVLIGLTIAAFATLLAAMATGGIFVPIHVMLDLALVGYVMLLVRHRQMVADRHSKVEPIRPPVTEQPPATLQPAPYYLLRSGT